jgi:uroporphyrinogen-III synthase
VSLAGKNILVTRTPEQSRDLAAVLQALGAHVVFLPAIEISEPADWTRCDRALDRLADYHATILTSANAVRMFAARASSRRVRFPELLQHLVPGIGTRRAAEDAGLTNVRTLGTGTAESLAEAMVQQQPAGKKFLFPCGELAREVVPDRLRAAGGVVDRVVVYRTTLPAGADNQQLREQVSGARIDVAMFASPSAVHNMNDMLGSLGLFPRVAAIGPTTAAALRGVGREPDIIAAAPDVHAFAHAIEEFYAGQ